MSVSKDSVIRALVVTAISVAGAALMTKIDRGGTAWLKFVLYFVMLSAGFFVAIFAPATACGWPSFRKRTKS